MPITQTAYSVGTAVVQVVAPDTQPQYVTLHNLESQIGRTIFIGNSQLVAGQSVEISPAVFLQMTLGPGDNLCAVTDGGTYQLGVMIQKQD